MCILTAALVVRNGAQGNSDRDRDRDRSIVVESRTYAVLLRSAPNGSLTFSLRKADQALGEVGVDAPVAGGRSHWQAYCTRRGRDAHVIELLGLRAQTGFDVAQALAERQLRKRHAQELIQARKAQNLVIPTITRHASRECLFRQVLHQLREHQFPRMHNVPRSVGWGEPWHSQRLKSRTPLYASFLHYTQ